MPMQSIEDLLERLIQHPAIVGLAEYGSDHRDDGFASGDYDLFVIFDELETEVESLHFHVCGVPVDLNLRTLDYLRRLESPSGFETALAGARVIYDRTGELTLVIERLTAQHALAAPLQPSEHSVAMMRHGHRHVFDKLRGRLDSEPLLCKLLLHTDIHWLIESYFAVRGLQYRGEKDALAHLRQHEPQAYALIERFYAASTLEEGATLAEDLTELVLAPVGGMWRDDEVLAFGDDESRRLQEQGRTLYQELCG